jgi:hypothetical protein
MMGAVVPGVITHSTTKDSVAGSQRGSSSLTYVIAAGVAVRSGRYMRPPLTQADPACVGWTVTAPVQSTLSW